MYILFFPVPREKLFYEKMMINNKYLFLCMLIIISYSCKSYKEIEDERIVVRNTCSFCDTLQKFSYPLRAIDRNIEGIPLFKDVDMTNRDSFQVLTELEVKSIEEALFCFLGKEEKVVDLYFPSEMERDVWGDRNSVNITKTYSFNKGQYVNNKTNIYLEEDGKSEDADLCLLGTEYFSLRFVKIESKFVYSGVALDTLRLSDCEKNNQ